jgi:hypothetical protein
VFFFSYRYYHSYHGAKALPSRAILVPTAERDEAIGLELSPRMFRGVRALMYNSPEEKRLIQAVSNNYDVPGVVVGIGSEIPSQPQPERFRQKYGITDRFALYVGRIDQNKGCKELFGFFLNGLDALPKGLQLVLIGKEMLPIPDHPAGQRKVRSFEGPVRQKPGRAVLRNRRRVRRDASRDCKQPGSERGVQRERPHLLSEALCVAGHRAEIFLGRLKEDDSRGTAARGMDPEPGWFAKRRRTLRPANDVLAELPFGPVLN